MISAIISKYNRKDLLEMLGFFIIFIAAFFVRSYKLAIFPLNHDECRWILPSVEHFDKFMKIPVSCFNGYVHPFICYLVFFSRKIFSSPIYIVRMPAVIIGVATVILTYKLAKEMYGRKAGLIAGVLLCFLPWHVIQSRIGVEVILTPFFGCLIFLTLIRSIRKQSNAWFLCSCSLAAIGSFYTYQVSLLFMPIFGVALFFLRKDLRWLKPKIILLSILIIAIIVLPLIFLQMSGQIEEYLRTPYQKYYQDGEFNNSTGMFFRRALVNFKNNSPIVFESLFIASRGRILNGRALDSALLINWASLFIILFSVFISFRRRGVSDNILLVWAFLGSLGALSGVRFSAPRYSIIVLIPFLILMSKAIAEIFNYSAKKTFFKRGSLFLAGIILCAGLVSAEIFQLVRYYFTAPMHVEEWRWNSYGCEEAALYLSKIPDIEKYQVVSDRRMTTVTYLKYLGISVEDRSEVAYYVIWASEPWPEDYADGLFSRMRKDFRDRHPDAAPIKTIYYPNGQAAIYIFKV